MELTFTAENLQLTYGGRLTVLTQATEALLQKRPVEPPQGSEGEPWS